MTFLPIVQRELRVAARRRGTFRARIAMAVTSVLVGGAILFLAVAAPPQKAGLFVFQVLTGLALVYCLLAGRQMTADCLSEEKREGTLGLLFLTDLKGHDIILGKLAATSLPGFYGLLATFPVIAVPLLMGGVSSAEFWRVVLVLVVTFVFSLSLGLFVSSITRDGRRAMGINLVLLLLIAGGPAAVAAIISAITGAFPTLWTYVSSPPYTVYLCFDARYKLTPDLFWTSVSVLHGLSWLMLALASWIVPHSWQERSRPQPALPVANSRTRLRDWLRGNAAQRKRFRDRLLRTNAFYWLASRVQRRPDQVWVFFGFMGMWWLFGWLGGGRYWMDEASLVAAALLLNTTIKIWFAIMAGQQLAEERRSGTLEFLLSTPLSVKDIIRGQWLALRRQFAGPVVVLVALHCVFAALPFRRQPDDFTGTMYLAGAAMLLADLVALGWLGMWQGLIAKSHPRATYATIVRILALPWIVLGIIVGATLVITALLFGRPEPTSAKTKFYLWLVLGLVTDAAFALWARRRLLTQFREVALRQFGVAPAATARVEPGTASTGLASSKPASIYEPARAPGQTTLIRSPPELPLRRRRFMRQITIGTAALLALSLLGFWIYRRSRPSFPQPHLAFIGQPTRPFQAFPMRSSVLILPGDGTVWDWGAEPGNPKKTFAFKIASDASWSRLWSSGARIVGITLDRELREVTMPHGPLDMSIQSAIWTSAPVAFYYDQALRPPWKDVVAYANYTVALGADGTLWVGGDSLGGSYQQGPQNRPRLSKWGTETNWVAVTASFMSVLALERDGTLWVWGRVYDPWGGAPIVTDLPTPTRVCRETNWVSFVTGFPPMILNKSGELWELLGTPPQPDGLAGAVCRLVATNASPGRITAGLGNDRMLYQIRSDNTLWARSIPLTGQWGGAQAPWQRLGKRSDWVSIQGGGPMTFGMTADGTLWTWGYDPTGPVRTVFSLALVQARVGELFGGSAANLGRGLTPKMQLEPRPLVRFATNALARGGR